MGILQFGEFRENPPRVRFRYKLFQPASPTAPRAAQSSLLTAKIQYAKYLGLAVHKYAADNDGQMPTNYTDLATYVLAGEDPAKVPQGFDPRQFEILYRGSFFGIKEPSKTIILREKEATRTADGQSLRVCVFADGHVETQSAAPGP